MESASKAVSLNKKQDESFFSIQIPKLSQDTQSIVICYSIYEDGSPYYFNQINDPCIRVFADNIEKYQFALNNLNMEKTVVGIEIYRHNGLWKIGCVGSGYNEGLKKLCEDYGLEVID